WQANKKRTCAPPVLLGLCPKMKYHPLCGWIFIARRKFCASAGMVVPSGEICYNTNNLLPEAQL
ncbi:MAG: hypothetical protein IKT90_00840, partial [Clostridia bacterium]|nr:hypothetical protein [Clostridia bacterium]